MPQRAGHSPDDREADRVRKLILAGATVFMGFNRGRRVWWIEVPYTEIEDEVMSKASTSGNGGPLLVEARDSLFGWTGNSQTWRSAYAVTD